MRSRPNEQTSETAREELERLHSENESLRHELAETNRGVTALYSELDRRAEELEHKDRQKDEFLAMLGHELRNPLAAARAALDYLERISRPEGDDAARARSILERQLHNLHRIVDDLLEVSRIARGQVELRTEATDLTSCVRTTAQTHRKPVEDAGHELHVSLPGEPLWGWFDATRTEQILANLLDNAIKYTPPPGRIDIRARRTQEGPEARAHIEIQDTGEGIEPERLPHVFKPFVQEQRTLDRARGGLGLGLSLVQRLVELHGGTIEAHSEGRGHGSTFSIWLPLSESAAAAGAAPRAETPRAGERRRVLLVEDNDDLRETLAEILELDEYDVETARTGDEGLERARERPRDVILIDIGLPGMDGFELARRRGVEAPEGPALIALTGYGDERLSEAIQRAGFDGHLVKPVALEDLYRAIGSSRDRREPPGAQPA